MSFYTIGNDGICWVTAGPFSSVSAAKHYAMNHTLDRAGRWDRVPEVWPEKFTRLWQPTEHNGMGRCPVYGKGADVWCFDSFLGEWVKEVK